jgi:serine protease AprX
MLRQAQVTAVRNECYRTIAPVYTEIERLSTGPLQPGPEIVGAPQIPTLMTQVCWLNRTVRTWAGPETLTEVAADKSVSRIDVPRRLMPEASFAANQKAIRLDQFVANSALSGKGVTVAVIDTEVALNHPALRERVVQRRNFTPEPWGNPHGHGTAVAGIIAARDSNNGGIAPDAIIYNYKVLATNRFLNSDDFGGALALQQAVEDNVDIANCSWGAGPVGGNISREARAVVGATEAGMTVVKSAGNAGPNGMTMTSPAEALEAIVVGATDIDGNSVQDYSSRGAAGARLGPDVVAPGGTQDVQIICCQVGGGFGGAGAGTSFAAPHISGVLALLLEQDPELTPERLLQWVRDHGHDRPGFAVEDQGQGLLILT